MNLPPPPPAMIVPAEQMLDMPAFLHALRDVENPKNSSKPGLHGELGPYQFKEKTWHMHTKLPFILALDRKHADPIAWAHVMTIIRALQHLHDQVTPENVAIVWQNGLSAFMLGEVPHYKRVTADRIANLYSAYHWSQKKMTP